MALKSFHLFQNQVSTAPESLKLCVLHIIFDVLMVNDDFLAQPVSEGQLGIVGFLLQLLDDSDAVQAVVAKGFAKLLLARMIPGDTHRVGETPTPYLLTLTCHAQVLYSLAALYLSPDSAGNQDLRQCLTFFFPIYACSCVENQQSIRKVFIIDL